MHVRTHIRPNVHAHMGACTDELQKQPSWETVNSPNHRVHRRVRGDMGKQGACVQCTATKSAKKKEDGRGSAAEVPDSSKGPRVRFIHTTAVKSAGRRPAALTGGRSIVVFRCQPDTDWEIPD